MVPKINNLPVRFINMLYVFTKYQVTEHAFINICFQCKLFYSL